MILTRRLPLSADGMPVTDTWQPLAAAPGLGSIVWVNYSGTDELTVDLAGQLYKVAPQNHGIPGRLQIDVPSGFYRYTASVPYGSINGELSVGPGEVIGVNVIPDIRAEPEYKVGEEFEIPPVTLNQFQESLTAWVSAPQPQADAVPPALPAAGDEVVAPAEIEAAVVPAGVSG